MTEEQRSAIYGVGLAVLAIAGGYGLIAESQIALWAAFLDGMLVAATAFWHRPTKG